MLELRRALLKPMFALFPSILQGELKCQEKNRRRLYQTASVKQEMGEEGSSFKTFFLVFCVLLQLSQLCRGNTLLFFFPPVTATMSHSTRLLQASTFVSCLPPFSEIYSMLRQPTYCSHKEAEASYPG